MGSGRRYRGDVNERMVAASFHLMTSHLLILLRTERAAEIHFPQEEFNQGTFMEPPHEAKGVRFASRVILKAFVTCIRLNLLTEHMCSGLVLVSNVKVL